MRYILNSRTTAIKNDQVLYSKLLRGAKIYSHISGWYWNHRRLKVETRDALEATGELVECTVNRRFLDEVFVTHCDAVEIARGDSTIVKIKRLKGPIQSQ